MNFTANALKGDLRPSASWRTNWGPPQLDPFQKLRHYGIKRVEGGLKLGVLLYREVPASRTAEKVNIPSLVFFPTDFLLLLFFWLVESTHWRSRELTRRLCYPRFQILLWKRKKKKLDEFLSAGRKFVWHVAVRKILQQKLTRLGKPLES